MRTNTSARESRAELFGLTTIVILTVAYILLRYGGGWSLGGDAALFTRVTRSISTHGSLLPPGEVYPNGFGYQALLLSTSKLTGLDLHVLQAWAFPLLFAWLVLPVWLLYRELLHSHHAATLAVAIIFLQPELIFVNLRGTHEKFTRGLMMLCLFLLVRSIRSRDKPRIFAGLILASTLTAAAIIHFNNLFSTSLLMAILLSLALVYLVKRFGSRPVLSSRVVKPLLFVLSMLAILTFVFMFYAYPPAMRHLHIIESTTDRIAALFLDVATTEQEIVNPYSRWLQDAWINRPVYALMTLASWLLLLASAAMWVWQTTRWFLQQRVSDDEGELLLWAFFGAFAIIGFLSILADFSGALSSNLQHRVFPSFAIFAAPVISMWLLKPWAGRMKIRTLLIGLFSFMAVVSLLKATPEPLLSNKWQYVLRSETLGLEWAQTHLRDRRVWTEFDGRLSDSIVNRHREEVTISMDRLEPEAETRDFLVSELTRLRAERLAADLPLQGDDFITYDNGQVQFFHRRPETLYQR